MLALQLERNYSKEQIYLLFKQSVYGNNVWWIWNFTTISIKNYLNSLILGALLAGMPQAPKFIRPMLMLIKQKNVDLVLYSMKEKWKITKEQYDQAVATPVTEGLIAHNNNVDSNDKALVYDSFKNGFKRSSRKRTLILITMDLQLKQLSTQKRNNVYMISLIRMIKTNT